MNLLAFQNLKTQEIPRQPPKKQSFVLSSHMFGHMRKIFSIFSIFSTSRPTSTEKCDQNTTLGFEPPVVGGMVEDTATDAEIWASILGPVKSDAMSPKARRRCNVSSELCCPGAKQRIEFLPRHSLHASA